MLLGFRAPQNSKNGHNGKKNAHQDKDADDALIAEQPGDGVRRDDGKETADCLRRSVSAHAQPGRKQFRNIDGETDFQANMFFEVWLVYNA